MCENILLQSLKYIQINIKYIHLHFFCKSKKLYFSCYSDVDTDRYPCSHKVCMYLRMRILMRIRMRTGLFPTLWAIKEITEKLKSRCLSTFHWYDDNVNIEKRQCTHRHRLFPLSWGICCCHKMSKSHPNCTSDSQEWGWMDRLKQKNRC